MKRREKRWEWHQPVKMLRGETKQGRLRTEESGVPGPWGHRERM